MKSLNRQRGQILVAGLIWLPVFVLILSVTFRAGYTALNHYRIQRFIDIKAIQILSFQGEALKKLGNLNKPAKAIILARRTADLIIKAGVAIPPVLLAAVKARVILMQAQKLIALRQKEILAQMYLQIEKEKHRPLPEKFRSKIELHWDPQVAFLNISDEVGYEFEVGAPKVLTRVFDQRQYQSVKAKVQTEGFLKAFASKSSLPDMQISTFAKLKMKDMESNWTAKLAQKSEGKIEAGM